MTRSRRSKRLLLEAGLLDDDVVVDLEAEVEAELEAAVAFAEASPLEPVEDLTRFTYSTDLTARRWRREQHPDARQPPPGHGR